jgi:hypothetical protein
MGLSWTGVPVYSGGMKSSARFLMALTALAMAACQARRGDAPTELEVAFTGKDDFTIRDAVAR